MAAAFPFSPCGRRWREAPDEGLAVSDKTGIEWTDARWNPIVGCSVVSR
jgi:hypothetical protein